MGPHGEGVRALNVIVMPTEEVEAGTNRSVDVLKSMRKRMNWTAARALLRRAGFEPSLGFDRTIDRLTDRDSGNSGALEDSLVEHLLCGNKFTKLYEADDATRDRLREHISTLQPKDCAAAAAFPLLLDDEHLATEQAVFELVNVFTNDDGIGAVFSSVFAMKVREEIDFEQFDKPSEMRAQFDEVVGLKFKRVQLFHVVWVPSTRQQVEIRVDYPPGMQEDAVHAHHSRLKVLVNAWEVGELAAPLNLFPAVRRFYDDDDDGLVSEITFSTTTSAIKHEKIVKRTKERLDQRKEVYHVAGKGALAGDIRVFRICIEWPFEEDGLFFAPSITLAASGPSGRGGNMDPVISGVFVAGCVRACDYEFAIDRLGRKAGIEPV